jgi:peptide/nickel transport system substrate-binding protein
MKKGTLLTIALMVIALTSLAVPMPFVAAQEEAQPVVDTIIFKSLDQALAAAALKAGDIDFYIFNLAPNHIETIVDDPDVAIYHAPAGVDGIGVNPAPSTDTEFNPFSIKDVRFAVNYLINRDWIVNQVYQGGAAPMYTHQSSYDPDYVTIYDIVAKYEFGYDLTSASALIDPALTAAGCTMQEGKWYYEGEPVTVKFVIRTEDQRRDEGDQIATALEAVGFTVDRMYMQFGQAIPIVYGSDPAELQWHLYTEGWGKSALTKYDSSTINQFHAPWYTWMPGFLEPGFWSYTNDTIDELGLAIFNGEFKSRAERDMLYRNMTEMAIQDAVRLYCITSLDAHITLASMSGLTEDLGTGLRSPWNLREAYNTDWNLSESNTLTIGSLHIWTETCVYNPIKGHDDVYSVDIRNLLLDPFVYPNPFTGIPQPFRKDYEVTTAGPDGTLNVPSDAWIWDNSTDMFVSVPEYWGEDSVTAMSKVVFDSSNYIGDKWHHNGTIRWADVVWSIQQFYEIAYDTEKSGLEGVTAAYLQSILPKFKGYKINRNDNTLTVWVDYWHFDENYIANYADMLDIDTPFAHYPWEVLAAMDQVVFVDGEYAYSQSASDRLNVPWLSLVLSEHAMDVNAAVQALDFSELEHIFNVTGTIYYSESDLNARKTLCNAWFNLHDNMVINDGPFYLDSFSAAGDSAVLKAFRDPSYPIEQGTWDYGRPTPPEITRVGIPTVVPGGASSFVIELSGVPEMGVLYLIKDPLTGVILDTGTAEPITASKFQISLSSDFTSDLMPGLYELSIAGFSEEVALLSTAREFFDVFNVNPLEEAFQDVGSSVSTEISTVNDNLSASISQLASSVQTLMILIGVVAVLVVASIFVSIRKK